MTAKLPELTGNNYYLPPYQERIEQYSFIEDTQRRASEKGRSANICKAITYLKAEQYDLLKSVLANLNHEIDKALESVTNPDTVTFAAKFALSLANSSAKDKCLQVCLSKLIGTTDPNLPQECVNAIVDPEMKDTCRQWVAAENRRPPIECK